MSRGSMSNIATFRRVNHLARPVYWSAKTSQSVGAARLPNHAMLSQKRVVGKSGLASSRAYPSDHSATASMSRQNAVAPGAGRRCHAVSANHPDITAAVSTNNTKGVDCQCISFLLSVRLHLSLTLVGQTRLPYHRFPPKNISY